MSLLVQTKLTRPATQPMGSTALVISTIQSGGGGGGGGGILTDTWDDSESWDDTETFDEPAE